MSAEYDRRSIELDPSLVAGFAATFIARTDVYPVQQSDGTYRLVHQPLDLNLITHHLLGQMTLGAYLLDPNSTAKAICLDADTPDGWAGLLSLARTLDQRRITAYPELSRRGGHLWLFIDPLAGL